MPGKPNELCIMVSTQFVGLVKEKSHLGKEAYEPKRY